MTELVDLTGSGIMEEFEFPEVDGLTNEDLASLDVVEIGRQNTLLRDFPRSCQITRSDVSGSVPTRGDILEEILHDTLSQAEIYRLGRTDLKSTPSDKNGFDREQDGRPIPVEVSAGKNDTEIVYVARKSSPAANTPRNQSEHQQMEVVDIVDDDQSPRNGLESKSHVGKRTAAKAGAKADKVRFRFEPEQVVIEPEPEKPKKVEAEEDFSISAQITKSVLKLNVTPTIEQDDLVKRGEGGFIPHNFPNASAEKARGPDPAPTDVRGLRDFISVRELAVPDVCPRRTVPNGIVPFLLVEYSQGEWKAAKTKRWEEITNRLEVKILRQHPDLRFVMKQAGRWRGAGSYGLDGQDVELLEKWRDLIPIMDCQLNTFPRDALTVSDEEVTIMLMDDLKDYELDALSEGLFTRNPSLQGHVRVNSSKKYGKMDFTSMNQSKDGWRLVYLEGDALFMQSLSQHTSDEKFPVGCGKVTIRGGICKPNFLQRKFSSTWAKKIWTQDRFAPILRTLTPVPIRTSTPKTSIPVRRAASLPVKKKLIPASSEKPKAVSDLKPRTRSDRLKIAKLKKAAARLIAQTK